jgi:hypothetical protein
MIVESENLNKGVNEMNFPGFNADASFYKTSGRYQMVSLSQASEAIHAQFIDKKCFDECHLKCIEKHCPEGG